MKASAAPREAQAPAGPVGWVRACTVAALFALTAGLLEVGLVIGAVTSGLQVRLSAHYVWMIPVANLAFFLLVATLLKVLAHVLPALSSRFVMGGVFAGLAALCLLLLVERIHDAAMLLLAAGLGVQASRLVDSSPARLLRRAAAPATAVLALAVLFLALSMTRTLARSERTALSALPAPRGASPNVLLLILDTVRQTSTSLEPGVATTPNLARVAARGTVFRRAIATAPWTLPSHGSLFTGRWAHELSTGWTTPLDRTHPTLAEALSDRGYEAVAFVGNTLFASRATGLGRGFSRYRDYPVSIGQVVVSTAWGRALAGWPLLWKAVGHHDTLNRRKAPSVTEDFVGWLDARESGRPFFAFINFFDAHEPTFPPGRSGSLIGPGPRWTRFAHTSGLFAGTNAWYEAKWELSPADREVYGAGYHDAVSKADAALGSVLDALSARGLMENTIVIVAGDHGEQLGEHHLFQHNNSLYLPALRVPLVVVAPGGSAGAVVDRVVSLRDVPATVLELLGLPNIDFPGRSLIPEPEPSEVDEVVLSYLEQDFVEREDYPVAKGRTTYALTSNRWHYIRNGDGSEELYDWAADPAETADLMGSGADSAAVRLRSEMDRLIRGR